MCLCSIKELIICWICYCTHQVERLALDKWYLNYSTLCDWMDKQCVLSASAAFPTIQNNYQQQIYQIICQNLTKTTTYSLTHADFSAQNLSCFVTFLSWDVHFKKIQFGGLLKNIVGNIVLCSHSASLHPGVEMGELNAGSYPVMNKHSFQVISCYRNQDKLQQANGPLGS